MRGRDMVSTYSREMCCGMFTNGGLLGLYLTHDEQVIKDMLEFLEPIVAQLK